MLFALDPYLAGWALVLEFIFTLEMALPYSSTMTSVGLAAVVWWL